MAYKRKTVDMFYIGNQYGFGGPRALPSEVDGLRMELPQFNIDSVYGDYYIVGFNKRL